MLQVYVASIIYDDHREGPNAEEKADPNSEILTLDELRLHRLPRSLHPSTLVFSQQVRHCGQLCPAFLRTSVRGCSVMVV